MKLIDKDALVAEMEKLKLCTMDEHMNHYSAEAQGEYNALSKLESFIDTLEVKEVDLEKAIDDYIYTYNGRKRLDLELDWKYCNLTLKGGEQIIKFAKHFFELGLKVQKGEKV